MDPYSGRTYTAEQMEALPTNIRERLVMVEGRATDVARLSAAAATFAGITSDERAKRRKARKVARASRRANR